MDENDIYEKLLRDKIVPGPETAKVKKVYVSQTKSRQRKDHVPV